MSGIVIVVLILTAIIGIIIDFGKIDLFAKLFVWAIGCSIFFIWIIIFIAVIKWAFSIVF